ncbi:MAG TPA: hypothetical protein VLF71_05095 [Candidatus Saccharimonadales bacterium]|nr:hypothetical protein [Candidatus Saccharimonadales bacterium]
MPEHMPQPDLLPVTDAERPDVAKQLEFAERIVRKAQLNFQGDDGSYWLHSQEEFTPPGGTEDDARSLGRPDYHEDTYMLLTPQGDFPVALTPDHTNFADRRAEQFRRQAKAVEDGQAAGTHSATAMSFIGQKGDSGPTVLEVTVTHATDTPGQPPRTSAEFRYVRHVSHDDSMVVQTRHIDLDPFSGQLRVRDSLEGLQWDGSHIPRGQEGDMVLVPDPLPEMTGAILQERYGPGVPVDRALNSADWQQLILGGPSRYDMVQPLRQGEDAPPPVPYEYLPPRTQ